MNEQDTDFNVQVAELEHRWALRQAMEAIGNAICRAVGARI